MRCMMLVGLKQLMKLTTKENRKMAKKENSLKKLWTFQLKDKTTWPYLTVHYRQDKDGKINKIIWVKNPDFKYSHLVPGYKNNVE